MHRFDLPGRPHMRGRHNAARKFGSCFMWHFAAVSALVSLLGTDYLSTSALCNARGTSAHFAGIGPDKLIVEQFVRPALARYNLQCHLEPMFSIASDPYCRAVLANSGSKIGTEHVGYDVLEHLHIGTLAQLNELSLADKIVTVLTAPVRTTLRCAVHGDACCNLPVCDVDCSGPPCVDWSPMGKQLGALGPTFALIIDYFAYHRSAKTRLLLIENVPEFDPAVAHAFLGDIYEIHITYITPADVACEYLSRMRMFMLCILKGSARLRCDLGATLDYVCQAIHNHRSTHCNRLKVSDVLVASYRQLRDAEELLAKARNIPVKPPDPTQLYNQMDYLLHANELRRLSQYEQLWTDKFGQLGSNDPDALYHLQDDPQGRVCWSAGGHIPSLRRQMGPLWHPHSCTVLTPAERLSLQGWPLVGFAAEMAGIQNFDMPFSERLNKFAGNAYHVAVFGTFMLVALSCTSLV
eukprot:TRINITY_DN3378_c0_g1_i5.p1 TRINITY_DN3378_c0_g1~~TRINITY_DN3378_c0_g1_i5.p1  ORF type:complete len:466 (-),score=53.11 TRINITY_DN3378_c0_g1_i5:234-1631(-)